jgi:hypothetical protein
LDQKLSGLLFHKNPYTSEFDPFETLTNLAKKICISEPSCGLGVAQVMGCLGLG